MEPLKKPAPDPSVFLAPEVLARAKASFEEDKTIYTQGDPADSVFYVRRGAIRISVVSTHGKQAIVDLLEPGDFFGEGCIAGQPSRMGTATAVSPSSLLRISKTEIAQLIHKDQNFSNFFISYLVSHFSKVEENLVYQRFNSIEKRLARALSLLARYGKEGKPETVIPQVNQEILAEMIGTSRTRVNIFMNKFKKMGLISYDGRRLRVHSSLLNVVLHD